MQSDPPSDEEIIRHLQKRAGRNALWITQDWNAFHTHKEALIAGSISVLWLRWPKYSRLSAEDKAQVLQNVIETVYGLVLESDEAIFLRVRLDSDSIYQPVLEMLLGSILKRPVEWERVRLI